jgi:hypothetical protein
MQNQVHQFVGWPQYQCALPGRHLRSDGTVEKLFDRNSQTAVAQTKMKLNRSAGGMGGDKMAALRPGLANRLERRISGSNEYIASPLQVFVLYGKINIAGRLAQEIGLIMTPCEKRSFQGNRGDPGFIEYGQNGIEFRKALIVSLPAL